MTNPFTPPSPFNPSTSTGGMSYQNPNGMGGTEVSPTGNVTSIGYRTGGGGIYTPPNNAGINPAMPISSTDNSAELASQAAEAEAARQAAQQQAARQAAIDSQIAADRQAAQTAGQNFYPIYNRDSEGNPTNVSYFKSTNGKNALDSSVNTYKNQVIKGEQNLPVGTGTTISTKYPETIQTTNTTQSTEPVYVLPREFLTTKYLPETDNTTAVDRYVAATQGRSLIFENGGASVSGTINFLGKEVERYAGQQPVSYSDILPYKLRGTAPNISPTTNVSPYSFVLPDEAQQIGLRKQSYLAPAFVSGIYGAASVASSGALIGESVGLGLTALQSSQLAGAIGGTSAIAGTESYLTPVGLKETLEAGKRNPLYYILPATEIVGGTLLVGNAAAQAYNARLEAAKAYPIVRDFTKYSELNGKEYVDLYSQQIAEKRITPIGFAYSQKTYNVPVPDTKEFIKFFVPEDKFTLSGDFVSPYRRVVSGITQIPTDTGGYTFVGRATSQQQVPNFLTGKYIKTTTAPYSIGGVINPAEKAIFDELKYKGYGGNFYAGDNPATRIREGYGGIIVSPDKAEITRVLGGSYPNTKVPLSKDIPIIQYGSEDVESVLQPSQKVFVKPTNLASVIPEKDITDIGKSFSAPKGWGTKAQISLVPQFTESISEPIYDFKPTPATKLSAGNINEFIGNGIYNVGSKMLPDIIPQGFVVPQFQTNTQSLSQLQTNLQIQQQVQQNKQITRQIPILTPTNVETTSQVSIQTPVQNQIEQQLQQIIHENTVPPPPIPPINPITSIAGFPLNIPFGKKNTQRRIRQVPTYSIQIRRRGRYIPVASGLTRGEAIGREQSILLNNIARTGRIIPTGTKEVFGIDEGDAVVNQALFRTYKQRGGRQIPLPFGNIIQRSSANLKSSSEQFQIQEAKRMKKLMRGII